MFSPSCSIFRLAGPISLLRTSLSVVFKTGYHKSLQKIPFLSPSVHILPTPSGTDLKINNKMVYPLSQKPPLASASLKSKPPRVLQALRLSSSPPVLSVSPHLHSQGVLLSPLVDGTLAWPPNTQALSLTPPSLCSACPSQPFTHLETPASFYGPAHTSTPQGSLSHASSSLGQ